LAAILDFEKATCGEGPPGLNFMETHRTIEKSKETIVKRPNKVMGPATGLLGLTVDCRKRKRSNLY